MALVDKILKCSADELEKFTDAQIEAHFTTVLCITRPVAKAKVSPILTRSDATRNKPQNSSVRQEKLDRAKIIAEKFGVDINTLL